MCKGPEAGMSGVGLLESSSKHSAALEQGNDAKEVDCGQPHPPNVYQTYLAISLEQLEATEQ